MSLDFFQKLHFVFVAFVFGRLLLGTHLRFDGCERPGEMTMAMSVSRLLPRIVLLLLHLWESLEISNDCLSLLSKSFGVVCAL